jgi:hypothetical protein
MSVGEVFDNLGFRGPYRGPGVTRFDGGFLGDAPPALNREPVLGIRRAWRRMSFLRTTMECAAIVVVINT